VEMHEEEGRVLLVGGAIVGVVVAHDGLEAVGGD
jgi:hypothetical protein